MNFSDYRWILHTEFAEFSSKSIYNSHLILPILRGKIYVKDAL